MKLFSTIFCMSDDFRQTWTEYAMKWKCSLYFMSFLCKIEKRNTSFDCFRLLLNCSRESVIAGGCWNGLWSSHSKENENERETSTGALRLSFLQKRKWWYENRNFIASSRADYRRLENLTQLNVMRHRQWLTSTYFYLFIFYKIVWYILGENKTV